MDTEPEEKDKRKEVKKSKVVDKVNDEEVNALKKSFFTGFKTQM